MTKIEEALILLFRCMTALNEIPNTKLRDDAEANDTYDLAAQVSKFIKTYPYDGTTVSESGN